MIFRYDWASPLGTLRMQMSDDVLTGLYFENHQPSPKLDAAACSDRRPFASVIQQLEEYFARDRRCFEIPVQLDGTDFQVAVWRQLLAIPIGETTSYGNLAERLDRPRAVRAVGAAVSRNPVSIIVPCHRVVGAAGQLTGFAGGLSRKEKLLSLEQQRLQPRS